jgi:CRISPR type III-B/RAMP module RAMP protein Cmr6
MYKTKLKSIHGNFPIESPSLRISKFANISDKKEDKADEKRNEICSIVSTINKYQLFNNTWREDFNNEAQCKVFTAKLGARLIVNSSGGVLENAGLCLHRNFGCPIIPGSAVKGIARHAAWCDWNEEKDVVKKKNKALIIAEVFGFPTNENSLDAYAGELTGGGCKSSGKVCFFEAYPTNKAEAEVDILNVHHRGYYAGETEVALDNENPILCYFPTVKAGTEFAFRVLRLGNLSDENFKQAVKWLRIGLSQHGIGAKTAAGYGWFDIPDDKTEISVDESFLEYLRSNYLREERPRADAFKKDYKKGKIVVDTDGKMRAICQFMGYYKIKVGGEWQQDINRMFKEFGMEVL